ncbi:MAG TPA: site-2 protease family protein [Gemmataceae bacterium]|nr:site-2 protease family protein [Gemmataceae bacterium]
MDKPAAAADLERRKQVRIRLRGDLAIDPQKFEGRTYYVVKDPVSLRYYRFKEQEQFLLQFMDGDRTLDDAQKEYEKRFRPERLTLEDLESFAQQLLTAGLAQNESPKAGTQLFERRRKRLRKEWLQTLTNILYIKLPIYDPDRLLGWMLQYTWWIFTPLFLAVSVGVMLAAIALVTTHFDTFLDRLPSYHVFFQFKTIGYLWVALGLVKIIHEFGHGLSCKAFGGEVHEMGALFLCFSPCLYANVSDAWTLPNKWHRIIISAAGIYVELIIAAIATFVWWNTPSHPFVNNMALSLMIVCSVSTVVFNANPLMRYDGYYVLADWLEIPNLRDRSNRYLKNVVLEHCLGVEVQPEPYMALWRRWLFVSYAIVSWLYRWIVTFSILGFMATFLKPYKLQVVSQMLAIAAAGSLFGWPLYNLGKSIYRRGRLPDMKRAKVTVCASIVGAVVLFFFLVPLPVSRVNPGSFLLPTPNALIQVQPNAQSHVYLHVPYPCILEQMYVRDGDYVEKDQVLAVFSCRELDKELVEEETNHAIKVETLNQLDRQMASTFEPGDRKRIEKLISEAAGDRNKHYRAQEHYRNAKEFLVLRAPDAGVIMSPPKVDEIGKVWEKDTGVPFCTVGDPTQLRVLLPVEPADYRLLDEDTRSLQAKQGEDARLDVTIRVRGREAQTWKGRIEPLPESEAKDIPTPLTNKAGGPIALRPEASADRRIPLPQTQQYLVSILIENPDKAIMPGTLAQVKVHCRWRSCFWWTRRAWSVLSEKWF